MKSEVCEGRLTKWNDDRGFGFIQPIDGSKEVFLHISALKKAVRRPQVGDMIWYDRVTEENGKIRAVKASIQGLETISHVPTEKSPRQSPQDKTARMNKSTFPQRRRRRGAWNSWINPFRELNPLIVMIPLIAVGVIGSVIRGNFTLPFSTKKYSAPVSMTSSPVPISSTIELGSSPAPVASATIPIQATEASSLPVVPTVASVCVVKGNISVNSGRKLYHVPGMEDYEITTINESQGERWFCTEADAIANGWVKAPK